MSDCELPEELSDYEDENKADTMIMQFQMIQGLWVDSNNNTWCIKDWEATSIRDTDGFVQKFMFEETDHRLYLNHARVEHVAGDIVMWSFSPIFLQGSTWTRPPEVKKQPPPQVTYRERFITCAGDDVSSTSSSDWVVV